MSVSFDQSSYSVAEGNAITVTLRLDIYPERPLTIPLTKTDQGGASSADYSGVPDSVTFSHGETSKAFTFTAVADSSSETGESVVLALGDLPADVSAGTTNQATVNLTD